MSFRAAPFPQYEKSDSKGNTSCNTQWHLAVSNSSELAESLVEYLLVLSSASEAVFIPIVQMWLEIVQNEADVQKWTVKSYSDSKELGDFYFTSSNLFASFEHTPPVQIARSPFN